MNIHIFQNYLKNAAPKKSDSDAAVGEPTYK